MAISQQQKVDFLLKKIGYTKTKTGLAVDSSLSGTKKAGFAEALPSPLIIADTSLWTESGLIPTTPPGSDTSQVKVYAPAGALRMTVDSTVANNRAFIAYTTYNNTSSARLTNWIDTQFGNDYIIQVFYDDATNNSKKLSASGSGNADGWFFDYSTGVLNFNDTNVPTGITTNNVYIVGYRYTGKKGILPPVGFGTFSSLDVSGIATFRDDVQFHGVNAGVTSAFWDKSANEFKFIDDTKLSFGTGQDLQLSHDGSTSLIRDARGSGVLKIGADKLWLQNKDGNEPYLEATDNGSVKLYYDFGSRIETTGYGVSVYGGQTGIGTIGAPAILHIDPAAVGAA